MNRDDLVAAGFIAGWRAVRLLPERTSHAGFRRLADRIHAKNGRSVRQLRENLSVAAGRPADEELTRRAVRSYLRYWCEAFRLPSWPTEDLVRRTSAVGEHHLRDAFAGRGCIAALPHTANWDWAGAWACATGMPVVSVAERLKPERVYDEFIAYRRSIGMEILPLDGTDTLPRLADRLEQGKLVCLLADRDLSRTSVEVELLGRRARVPSGPAVLAKRTGAALVPATFAYDGDGMRMTFGAPVPEDEPQAMMQSVADAFTAGIRSAPQDWHMMQRVFT